MRCELINRLRKLASGAEFISDTHSTLSIHKVKFYDFTLYVKAIELRSETLLAKKLN